MYVDSPLESPEKSLPTISEKEEGPSSTLPKNILERFDFEKIETDGASSFEEEIDPCKLLSVPGTGKFLFETELEREMREDKKTGLGGIRESKREDQIDSQRTMMTVKTLGSVSGSEKEDSRMKKIRETVREIEASKSEYKIDLTSELNKPLDGSILDGKTPHISEKDLILQKNKQNRNFFRFFWEEENRLSYFCCSISPTALVVVMLIFFCIRSIAFLIIFNLLYLNLLPAGMDIILNTYAILFILFPPFGSILYFGGVRGSVYTNRILVCLDFVVGLILLVGLLVFVVYHLGRFLVPDGYSDFDIFWDRVGSEPVVGIGLLLPWLYHDLVFMSFFFVYQGKGEKS